MIELAPTPEAIVPDPCDHQWENVDDSFDHEFGTEVICFQRCEKCGSTRDSDPDYCPD